VRGHTALPSMKTIWNKTYKTDLGGKCGLSASPPDISRILDLLLIGPPQIEIGRPSARDNVAASAMSCACSPSVIVEDRGVPAVTAATKCAISAR
jgi:hypothetical protein